MGVLIGLVMLGVELLMFAAMIFVIKPLMIRASLVQDFAKSFDIAYVKKFVKLTEAAPPAMPAA